MLAAYSLGNFVFDQGWADGTDEGLALRLVFDSQGLRAVQALEVTAGAPAETDPTCLHHIHQRARAGISLACQAELDFRCQELICAQAEISTRAGI